MSTENPFIDFTARLKLLISKHPSLITTTLSNIFTMRLIGNKTHGDLAEIAIAEFINQFMYDFKSIHVGKDLFRAKSHEEDIKVINEITKSEFPVSLKAYGDGPLQLSTDKSCRMFSRLLQEGKKISDVTKISQILADPAFVDHGDINVLPLIYNEDQQKCNILVFDYQRAVRDIRLIELKVEGSGRKHPVYRFYNPNNEYICEVRYGDAAANALQRGLWTHTKNAVGYFDSLTGGWISYSHSKTLVTLFSHALISTEGGQAEALAKLKEDIVQIRLREGLKG